MLTPKQIKVFEAFLRQPYQELTYKKVKEYSKEKSNSVLQKAIAKFLSEELITKNKIGNMLLYSANFENSKTLSYFEILIQEMLPVQVKKALKYVLDELSGTPFVAIVIFGSYADNTQTEKSDLDIALFVRNTTDKRTCELAMKSAELKSLLPIDYQVLTKKEMLFLLKDKHENVGTQIARKHLAVHNAAIFYSIVKEGINNGFKIIPS